MFYEALRRSKTDLHALSLPAAPSSSARVAANALKFLFDEARRISGDYETLFTWDRVSDYALIADACVPCWRRMIDHIEHFDLSTIDHDILGRLFERLIEPHERYEWGQHYTSSDIADLMLSFALPDGKGVMFDPAAGGGTFLVRAYARKKAFYPEQTHQERLAELYGTDVSRFAATIATVNLAVRQLDFEDNYPRIKTKSFFAVAPNENFMELPITSDALAGARYQNVKIPEVRALVGNPPYIRLHKLGKERQQEALQSLKRCSRVRAPLRLSRLANYHLYFWFHGAQFLERHGCLAFLTSGEWMDSDYGVALQQWLLDNFKIVAFIESGVEAWFSEARVGTVVTIAERCDNHDEREANPVRFVTLRQSLRTLFGQHVNQNSDVAKVDALRSRILDLNGSGESLDLDWSVVRQEELRSLGSIERGNQE